MPAVCKCGGIAYDEEGRCKVCRRFPTLGYQVGDWMEARCAVPDRDQVGEPFVLTNEQWKFLLHFYRVNPHVQKDKKRDTWRLPFTYSRGAQLTRPQKWGKGPFLGAIMCAEGAGPVLFDGWDAQGQPVGRHWSTPIVQIAASSEDQTDNVWMALLPMITLGDFGAEIPDTGLKRIYLPQGGWMEPVASSARSRLGQRITFLGQDQTESWTQHNGGRTLADTQRRNIAGMGGRWLSTCNAWDPAEESVAQYTSEFEALEGNVLIDDIEPPDNLSIRNKPERRRALKIVYGDSWWVDLDRIDVEIISMLRRDPAQAERWFLNRKRAAESAAFTSQQVEDCVNHDFQLPPKRTRITIGVDGARFVDGLGIVATDVSNGDSWSLGIWERPESAPPEYEHPWSEVDGAITEAFEFYDVWRAYVDPQYIESWVEAWQGRWGQKRVIEWRTNRPRQIAHSVRAFTEAVVTGDCNFSMDASLLRHLKNARRRKLNVYDEEHRQMYTFSKERPDSPLKMDGAMAAVLAWEAKGDCVAAGEDKKKRPRRIGMN